MENLKLRSFRCLRFFFQLLVLSWTVMNLVDTESAAPIQFRGEVGGSVTFRCPNPKQRKIIVLYLQKGDAFVNGYHLTKKITEPTWPNTTVNNYTNEVLMSGLNISHSGDYRFIILYNDTEDVTEMAVRLNVTAKFSTPSVNMSCPDETHFKSCIATCISHGGFPYSNMTWNVLGTKNTSNDTWKLMNRSSTGVQNRHTKLFTSFSTALFNCSTGELKFSCSVGGVTSGEHSVCAHQDPPPSNLYVIIAAACLVFIVMLIVGLWCWKCKKRPMGTAERVVTQELKANACETEIIDLTKAQEETEAS